MSIKLAQHVFGIALALLPLGLLVTILTHNGAWFGAAIILAVEIVICSLLYTIYRNNFRK
jgi:hypothetical protein